MIFIFTGNGKGKTTSAIGQAVRVIGQGERAAIIQFIKSRKWAAGEDIALKVFGKNLKFIKGGKGFVGIMGDRLPKSLHKKAAEKTLRKAKKEIFSKKYGLVVLDEINVALSLKLVKLNEVLKIIKMAPKETDLILTGRDSPKTLIKEADLVTEFKEIRHPFKKGVWGKKGREY
ncbi:MAG: cob(I)yrinic acid a,c-diamide adenosyltransferase [Candidatus Nealsonbacteria bacterium]|nr:cob(I)yrinic acid a,c-diamide adenosyltransferase [Candidatus Nealsonbacteria bacterium]